MTNDPSTPDILGPLMDEFVERFRRGERPALTEFVQRHPELEADIRELFPALVMMEHADAEMEDSAAAQSHRMTADGRELTQLGDYRIVREIGRGGMGIIYEAVQESLGRHVALKVLPWNALLNPTHLKRFQREARVAAALHHTNIVPVFGVGEHEGIHFYAMQFIRGQSLDNVLIELRLLRQRDDRAVEAVPRDRFNQSSIAESLLSGATSGARLHRAEHVENVLHVAPATDLSTESRVDHDEPNKSPPDPSSTALAGLSETSGSSSNQHYFRRVAQIGAEVADALAYAHSHGVLHRDIKPSNLMIDVEGTVWVTDFGLARAAMSSSDHDVAERGAHDITHTGDLIGTLRYMAPERFRGQADARSDLYSLGLTLYEMLTLRTAFDATDRVELIRQVTYETPTPPRRVDAHIPRDLETIVLKAIARDPAVRYESATELADDLRRYLADRPIVARRTPLSERVVLWCRRNPIVAGLLALVALLLMVLGIGTTYSSMRIARQERSLSQLSTRVDVAERDALRDLYKAHLSQLRAAVMLPEPGRRERTFELVRSARSCVSALESPQTAIRELRDGLIAILPLFDLRLDRSFATPSDSPPVPMLFWDFDHGVTRYAREESDGSLSVRRIDDDREVARLPGIGPFVKNYARLFLRFSPDDRFLAVSGTHLDRTRRLQVWNIETQRLVGSLELVASSIATAHPLAFASNSEQLAFTNGDRIDWFDIAQSKVIASTPVGHECSFLSISPDGTRVATNGSRQHNRLTDRDCSVVVLDRQSGAPQQRLPHAEFVYCAAWSPDGRRLATAGLEPNVLVWDLAQPAVPLLVCRGHGQAVTHVSFSPDGELLLSSGTDQKTRVWSARSGELLQEIEDHYGVRFSTDGRWLGCAHPGRQVARFEIVENLECRTMTVDAPNAPVWSADFSPDDRLLAVGATNHWQLIDWRRGNVECIQADRVNTQVRFDSDGAHLLVAGAQTSLRRLPVERILTARHPSAGGDSNSATWPLPGDNRFGPPSLLAREPTLSVSDFDSSADERRMAVVLRHERVLVFAPQRPEEVVELTGHKYVQAVAMSPDGRWIATSAPDGEDIRLWDASTGQQLHSLRAKKLEAGGLGFSPDGRWLVALTGDHYGLYRVGTWEVAKRFSHEPNVNGSATFSPDGKWLALTNNSQVHLIATETFEEVARLPVRRGRNLTTGSVTSRCALRFNRSGTLLAIGTMQGVLQVWNLPLVRKRLAALELDWPSPHARQDDSHAKSIQP